MTINPIDPPTAGIEGFEPRAEAIGVCRQLKGPGPAKLPALVGEALDEGIGPGPGKGLAQRQVGGEQVIVDALVDLIADLMGLPGIPHHRLPTSGLPRSDDRPDPVAAPPAGGQTLVGPGPVSPPESASPASGHWGGGPTACML